MSIVAKEMSHYYITFYKEGILLYQLFLIGFYLY